MSRLLTILVFMVVCGGLFLHGLSLGAEEKKAPEKIEPDSSCLDKQCHGDLLVGPKIHAPLAEGGEACGLCHEGQANQHAFSYVQTGAELCYNCHESVSEKELIHAPLKEKEKACTSCHDPHASKEKLLLRDKSQALCLSCHGQEVKSADGRVINGLKQSLAEDSELHGPLKFQDCGACHKLHNNKEYRFLRGKHPATFYSAYSVESYGLCFSCHDDSLAAAKGGDDATNFRNGQQNLHYLHVNKKRKGRTCRTCHHWHGSKNVRLVRGSVPFGQWQIPLNFTASENGGKCSPGCHSSKGYDRVKPVIYNTSPGWEALQKGSASKPEPKQTAGKTGESNEGTEPPRIKPGAK